MKIISYVVRRDFGFAPNPFFDYCTLATCKPDIRKSAVVGDWVIGTSSKSTGSSNKLVFAMKVTEKLSFDKYWNDARFFNKRPVLERSRKFQYGDNIYHQENYEWVQIASHHSNEDGSINYLNVATDTKIDNVLISDHFYYFGKNGLIIPTELSDIIKIGPGHKYIRDNLYEKFLVDFLGKYDLGLYGPPFEWKKLQLEKSPQLMFSF
ncbi:hypothetical protein AB3504_04760 [Acinetobacter baumannii]|jgi:hypothetical protein|uniref:Nmad2 family putative nucleotide modification protein n=1 Tax=Acinetobacter baumannii TaxID=470 RepID=UPI00222193E6|nr:hypothetical protein [Acinetobacter baumannii]MCW1510903.1 hypothetical protein [Acinetobacter baumannii]